MKLGIVILNWNDAEGTGRCLAQLAQWGSLTPSLIVVDNASRDRSAEEIAEAFPAVTLVRSPVNRGFAGGNNLGIQRAMALSCDAVLLLNSDACIAEPDVATLLAVLERQGGRAIVGPAIMETTPRGCTCTYGGRDIARHSRTRVTHRPAPCSGDGVTFHEVDYVPGTVLLTTTAVLGEVGPLCESYFFSGEIADFCASARARGIRSLVDPSVEAQHGHSVAQPLRNTLYLYYTVRNRFLYIARHGGGLKGLLRLLWIGGAAFMMGRAMMQRDRASTRAVALGLMHGLLGRWGDRNEQFNV